MGIYNKQGKKIVVFGPDNAGKTTLAMECASLLGYTYTHSPGPVPVEQMAAYVRMMLENDQNLIFDRFPIVEEKTCGVILRGVDKFEGMQEEVADYLARIDLFIYCNPNLDVIMDWQEREQMDGIKENIQALRKAYDDLARYFGEVGYPLTTYDWTKGTKELDAIKERIRTL